MKSFPQPHNLYVLLEDSNLGHLKQRCLLEVIDLAVFHAYQENLQGSKNACFSLAVNHPLFNNQSLKTESFLCVHENTIYTPEFEEKMLEFIKSYATDFNPTSQYLKEDTYWQNQTQLLKWIKTYVQDKINILLQGPKHMSDTELLDKCQAYITSNNLYALQKISRLGAAFSPVLEVLVAQNQKNKSDITLLESPDFLEKLETFLSTALEGAAHLNFNMPAVACLTLAFSKLENAPLRSFLEAYQQFTESKKEKSNLYTARNLSELINVMSKAQAPTLMNAEQSDYSELGSFFATQTPRFNALALRDKKDILYYILKQFDATRIIAPIGNILLPSCAQLYLSSPELLEYRGISALIEVHKNTPLQPDDPLITTLAQLVPLIPDLPSYENQDNHQVVKKMLYKKDADYKLTNQVEERLWPLFETVMIKQLLEHSPLVHTATGKTEKFKL